MCASTLTYVALVMVPASVYQMTKGFIVVIVALLSIIFLKRKQYRHHWTGLFMIILGVFLVGFVTVSGNKRSGGEGTELFGIFLLILG